MYRWAMRCGSRILFFIAVGILIVGIANAVQLLWGDQLITALMALLRAIKATAMPLFGAIVTYHLDKWAADRERGNAAQNSN
jgi:hypothetical protein